MCVWFDLKKVENVMKIQQELMMNVCPRTCVLIRSCVRAFVREINGEIPPTHHQMFTVITDCKK